jgi:hypothetical protein
MWLGVRIGGVSWLPTPFRWGFGQKKSQVKLSPAMQRSKDTSKKIVKKKSQN